MGHSDIDYNVTDFDIARFNSFELDWQGEVTARTSVLDSLKSDPRDLKATKYHQALDISLATLVNVVWREHRKALETKEGELQDDWCML